MYHTFTGHHGAGLKAISTRALETSKDVGAHAFPTGVLNGAFICVWLETSEEDIIT